MNTELWTDDERRLREQLAGGETVVVSMRKTGHPRLVQWAKANGLFVRVDRCTEWGNPFVIPRDGDRVAVIAGYRERHLPSRPSLLARLPELRGKALGCWCAPEPCHGDVLKEACQR